MKLGAILFRATQDGVVMVESSDRKKKKKNGQLEKGMAKHFSILALGTTWTVWKGKKLWHWKISLPDQKVSSILLGKSREITPERMKRLIQSRNNAKLWMCLVVRLKSDAVKDSIALELGMLHPWIKVKGMWANEMTILNTDILGNSELTWTEMSEFNWEDYYIYYYGQESLRRNG